MEGQSVPGRAGAGSLLLLAPYTLDLWVRNPTCASDPLRQRPTVGPPGTPATGAKPDDCTGSAVTIKVRNRIDDERGRGPASGNNPDLTGETPDPALTGEPLPTPTN